MLTASRSSLQSELIRLLDRFTGTDGAHTPYDPSIILYRNSAASGSVPTVYEPSLCIIAQGSKRVFLGSSSYLYKPSDYLLISLDLPMSGQVLEASAEKPYLALQIKLDMTLINDLIMAEDVAGVANTEESSESLALSVEPLPTELLDAVVRLMSLIEHPRDAAMLMPLVQREIGYRLLSSNHGARLRRIAYSESHTHRIARSIDWIKHNYCSRMAVNELARIAHMSPSGFHAHFKAVTAMTPLQYQKQLRLHEARRLLLSQDLDATTVSHKVGYESPSQFNREYSRMFGAPPVRDLQRLRVNFVPV